MRKVICAAPFLVLICASVATAREKIVHENAIVVTVQRTCLVEPPDAKSLGRYDGFDNARFRPIVVDIDLSLFDDNKDMPQYDEDDESATTETPSPEMKGKKDLTLKK